MKRGAALPAKRIRHRRGVVRSYVLALHPNAGKAEDARYAMWWFQRYWLGFMQRLYGQTPNAFETTAGLGTLANQAQARARATLRAGRAAEKTTGQSFHCPQIAPLLCEAKIRHGKGTSFPYWVKPPLGPWIPAVTHRALNRALRVGGTLRPQCEVRQGKRGGLVAHVFVEYERRQPAPSRDVLGCDVGVNHGVSTSDGRTSKSLRPIMEKTRSRNAERQRQGHRCQSSRSAIKQELDREARRAVMLAARSGRPLAIERLKTLANLKPSGRLGGWARVHFGTRVLQIAEEVGVAVVQVNPAYTSITCLRCGHADKHNRRGTDFCCVQCGARAHADVLAARNLVRKATGAFPNVWAMREGRNTNTNGDQVPLAGGA